MLSRRVFLGSLGLAGSLRSQGRTIIAIRQGSAPQVFEGWGTSLCWWANIAGRFSQKTRDQLARQIFSLEDDGLGLNVVRYNIGGGENPGIPNTMELRARMEGFWPARNQDFNWDADVTQRAILDDAIRTARNSGIELRFETFAVSPPWWMTVSKSATGNTGPDGKPAENLAPEYYEDFARYLVRVTQYLEEKHRIRIDTISPFNEPTSQWWKLGGRQEGCFFTHAAMARLITAFDPYLKNSAYRLAAPEDWSIDQSLAAWNSFDAETRRRVGQINTHAYHGSSRAELSQCARSNKKKLWQSEYGDGDGSGSTLASTIIRDLKSLRPSAWVNWQVVSPGNWGMIENDHIHEAWSRRKKFYVMAQFSRFIRPGARLLDTDHPNAIAAYEPSANQLSVVFHNSLPAPTRVTFDLSGFADLDRKATWFQTELLRDGGENLASKPGISIGKQSFIVEVNAASLSTFVAQAKIDPRII